MQTLSIDRTHNIQSRESTQAARTAQPQLNAKPCRNKKALCDSHLGLFYSRRKLDRVIWALRVGRNRCSYLYDSVDVMTDLHQ